MWQPIGINLIPLNLFPIFHITLSIPNYNPSGTSKSKSDPLVL
jgi:hypothetical protein